MDKPSTRARLTHVQFVKQAITALKQPPYTGIHTVYSGFNRAFREYFHGDDPVAVCQKLAAEGEIRLFLVRGGAMISLPPEEKKKQNVLKKILEQT